MCYLYQCCSPFNNRSVFNVLHLTIIAMNNKISHEVYRDRRFISYFPLSYQCDAKTESTKQYFIRVILESHLTHTVHSYNSWMVPRVPCGDIEPPYQCAGTRSKQFHATKSVKCVNKIHSCDADNTDGYLQPFVSINFVTSIVN